MLKAYDIWAAYLLLRRVCNMYYCQWCVLLDYDSVNFYNYSAARARVRVALKSLKQGGFAWSGILSATRTRALAAE